MTRREKILPLLGKCAQETVYFRPVMDDEDIWYATEAANEKAQALYLSLGFQKLDELDGDDLVFGL